MGLNHSEYSKQGNTILGIVGLINFISGVACFIVIPTSSAPVLAAIGGVLNFLCVYHNRNRIKGLFNGNT